MPFRLLTFPPPPAYAIPRSYPSDSSDGDDTPGQQSKARANGKPPVQPQLKPRSGRAGDMRASDSAGSDGSDTESTGTLDSHFARLAGSGGGRPPLGGLATRGFGRSNSRDVLLVARKAREQAKENEFLRRRVKELEEECGEYHEKVQSMRKHQAETKTRGVTARGGCGARGGRGAARARAGAHAGHRVAVRDRGVALVQKTSRLQNGWLTWPGRRPSPRNPRGCSRRRTGRWRSRSGPCSLRTTLEERGEWDGIRRRCPACSMRRRPGGVPARCGGVRGFGSEREARGGDARGPGALKIGAREGTRLQWPSWWSFERRTR